MPTEPSCSSLRPVDPNSNEPQNGGGAMGHEAAAARARLSGRRIRCSQSQGGQSRPRRRATAEARRRRCPGHRRGRQQRGGGLCGGRSPRQPAVGGPRRCRESGRARRTSWASVDRRQGWATPCLVTRVSAVSGEAQQAMLDARGALRVTVAPGEVKGPPRARLGWDCCATGQCRRLSWPRDQV